MDAYNYDYKTGEFLGISEADVDQLDPTNFLFPAFSTPIAPPQVTEGNVAVYANGSWEQHMDRRGQVWWNAEGHPVEIDFIGDPAAEGLLSEKPILPEPVPQVISRRQFYQGLAVEGKITKAEALAAVQTGAIPAALQGMVDAMVDEDAKFDATMLLAGAADYHRDHPLVLVIAMAQQMSETEVDDFWKLCFSL